MRACRRCTRTVRLVPHRPRRRRTARPMRGPILRSPRPHRMRLRPGVQARHAAGNAGWPGRRTPRVPHLTCGVVMRAHMGQRQARREELGGVMGIDAAFALLPRHVDLQQHILDLAGSGRGSDLQRGALGAGSGSRRHDDVRDAPRLMLPMKCHVAWGYTAALRISSSGRFSPKSQPPAAMARPTSSGPTVLETATRVTSPGSRPTRRHCSASSSRTLW